MKKVNIEKINKKSRFSKYPGDKYLVRGIGKRAIIVSINFDFDDLIEPISLENLILICAEHASLKGYKKIIVVQSGDYNDHASVGNISQWNEKTNLHTLIKCGHSSYDYSYVNWGDRDHDIKVQQTHYQFNEFEFV